MRTAKIWKGVASKTVTMSKESQCSCHPQNPLPPSSILTANANPWQEFWRAFSPAFPSWLCENFPRTSLKPTESPSLWPPQTAPTPTLWFKWQSCSPSGFQAPVANKALASSSAMQLLWQVVSTSGFLGFCHDKPQTTAFNNKICNKSCQCYFSHSMPLITPRMCQNESASPII